MNPTFIHNVIPGGLDVKVPVGTAAEVSTLLAKVPADKRMIWRLHRLQSGENLESVSRIYHSSSSLISQANDGLAADDIDQGQVLVVPVIPQVRQVAARYYWARGKRVPAAYYGARVAGRAATLPVKAGLAGARKGPVAVKSLVGQRKPAPNAPGIVALNHRRSR